MTIDEFITEIEDEIHNITYLASQSNLQPTKDAYMERVAPRKQLICLLKELKQLTEERGQGK